MPTNISSDKQVIMPLLLRRLARDLGLNISTGLSNLAGRVRPDWLRRISPTPGERFRMGVSDQLEALAQLAASRPELVGGITGLGGALGGAGLLGTAAYHGFPSLRDRLLEQM